MKEASPSHKGGDYDFRGSLTEEVIHDIESSQNKGEKILSEIGEQLDDYTFTTFQKNVEASDAVDIDSKFKAHSRDNAESRGGDESGENESGANSFSSNSSFSSSHWSSSDVKDGTSAIVQKNILKRGSTCSPTIIRPIGSKEPPTLIVPTNTSSTKFKSSIQRKNSIKPPRRPSMPFSTDDLLRVKKDSNKKRFNIGNRQIENYIKNTQYQHPFQQFWAILVFLSNCWNFISTVYFLGIPDTPHGFSLALELCAEFILLTDFFLRILLCKCLNKIWEKMWLLQEKNGKTWTNQILKLIGSFPQTFFLLCLGTDKQTMCSITVAALRALKLLRSYQISHYFEQRIMASKRKSTFSHIKTFQVVFNLVLAANFIGSSWLVTYRLEPKEYETWYSSTNMEDASNTERYVDAVFYVVATMTGLGYGDVIPLTYWEILVCLYIMATGATIFADFFGRFAAMIYFANANSIENRTKLEHAKRFAYQRNLPSDFKNKIFNYYSFMRLKYGLQDQRYKILHELPMSLRTELALYINVDLIQKVKLFQIADPSFIMAVTRYYIINIIDVDS